MSSISDALAQVFSTDGFVPRRICGMWPDWLIWEHVIGNALVWSAYVSIPLLIWRLGHRGSAWTPFYGLIRAFAFFIALCGLGHFLDMLAFYHPMYRLTGHILVATGAFSWWTVWSLHRAWPSLMALKSPAELELLVARRTEELARTVEELRVADVERTRLAKIVESSNDAIIGKDLEGVIISWNPAAETLFGYTAAEVLGRPITCLIPADRIDEERLILEKLRRGEQVDHFESIRVTKSGRRIDVSMTISPIRDGTGKVVGISKIARDITDRKDAEAQILLLNENLERRVRERTAELAHALEALREQDLRYQAIFDSTFQFIGLLDPDGTTLEANRTALEFGGMTREKAVGQPFWETRWWTSDAETQNRLKRAIREAADGQFVRYEVDVRGAGDEIATIDFSLKPMRDETGQVVLLIPEGRVITEQKRAAEALRRSEAALREAQRLAGVGSWEWDPATDVVLWSEELYRIARLDPSRPPPKVADQASLFTPESFTRLTATLEETLETGESYEIELEMIRGDGVNRWVIARGQATRGPSGKVVKLHGTLQDVTEQREQREEIRRAHDQAMAATRAKSDFVANMSHEIRTPMSGVIGMAELILGTRLDDIQRSYASTIRSSGEALLTVINDILDFAKIEAGKLTIDVVEFDLRALMGEVAELLAPRVRQKGIEIGCRIEPAVPPVLKGDPIRVRQVLTNLAGNAVKFTVRGSVTMEAIAMASAGDETTLRISIRDTGIGIPKDRQGEVFESFTQIDGGRSRTHGGTGLGLAICRNLVGLMGGTMGLESAPGDGSTFWFELTLGNGKVRVNAGDHAPADHPIAGEEEDRSSLNFRILLVEDNEVNRRVAIGMTQRLGCRADAVENGLQALEALDYERHDLILMDIQMPEMDGISATKAIREREQQSGRRIPIIAMTAHAMQGDRERCLLAGMDDYLTKPMKPGTLREALLAWGGPGRRALDEPPVDTPSEETSFRPETFRDSCGNDPDIVREVFTLMINGTPKRLERLEEAIAACDGRQVAREAHALKGTFLTVGADELASACEELVSLGERGDIVGIERAYPAIRDHSDRLKLQMTSYLWRLRTST